MSRFRRWAFRGLALALLISACVRIEDDRKKDAAPMLDAQPAPDSRISPRSCREIRNCVFDCGEAVECAALCVSSAPAVARAQYNQAQMCSAQVCPTQDIECRCAEECFIGGNCQQIVDECDEASSDRFCDGPCH